MLGSCSYFRRKSIQSTYVFITLVSNDNYGYLQLYGIVFYEIVEGLSTMLNLTNMKQILLTFILLIPNLGLAEWEIIKGNAGGDYEFSYHLKDIEDSEGKVKLWVRQKTVNEATKSQIELDCKRNTVTLLIVYFFNDRNWLEQGKINDVPHTAYIPAGSELESLAKALCK